MAKRINIPKDEHDKIREEFLTDFEKAIKSVFYDGKINFTKSFGTVTRRATVYYTEKAWNKQRALIEGFDKEVAWHGVAKRGDDPEKDEFYISDIVVYPQEVSGATADMDENEYPKWLGGLEDDVFNNLRMQAHSHVNMSTSPSGTDTGTYADLLERCEQRVKNGAEDMFYIFMIWNKRAEKTVKIYDFKNNLLFETSDCDIKIIPDEDGNLAFVEEAKKLVRDKVYRYTPTTKSNTYGGYDGYGYRGSHYGGYPYDGYNDYGDDDLPFNNKAASSVAPKENKSSTTAQNPPDKTKTTVTRRKGRRRDR